MLGKIMISCREASRLASESMDRRLGVGEKLQMHVHLAMCSLCSRYRTQARAIRTAIRTAKPPSRALSEEARERIRKSMAGQN
jgi:hypothetical protein